MNMTMNRSAWGLIVILLVVQGCAHRRSRYEPEIERLNQRIELQRKEQERIQKEIEKENQKIRELNKQIEALGGKN